MQYVIYIKYSFYKTFWTLEIGFYVHLSKSLQYLPQHNGSSFKIFDL